MVKKESAKRGYMTKSEIYNHLKGINSDKDRIQYLNTILEKRQLLAPETEVNLRELTAGFYMKQDKYDKAVEILEGPQISQRAKDILRKKEERNLRRYEEKGDFLSAGAVAEGLGMHDKAKEFYEKAVKKIKEESPTWPHTFSYSGGGKNKFGAWKTHEGELLKKAGRIKDAKKFYSELAKDGLEFFRINGPGYNYLESAIGYYKSAGEIDKARSLEKKHFGKVSMSERGEFLKKIKEEKRSLEGRILPAILTIVGLGAGIFFLSDNITGNAIADLSTNTTSWVGGVLLVVGLVAGFFWLRSKKK